MHSNYSEALYDELRLLARFPLESHIEGIKVHHEAAENIIAAAKRLFDKGMIDQMDGGYLTDSGREMAEHLRIVLDTLQHD